MMVISEGGCCHGECACLLGAPVVGPVLADEGHDVPEDVALCDGAVDVRDHHLVVPLPQEELRGHLLPAEHARAVDERDDVAPGLEAQGEELGGARAELLAPPERAGRGRGRVGGGSRSRSRLSLSLRLRLLCCLW